MCSSHDDPTTYDHSDGCLGDCSPEHPCPAQLDSGERRYRSFLIATNNPLDGEFVEKRIIATGTASAVEQFHKLFPTRTIYGIREV